MRPIMTFNRVTADGYFADREGKLDWVVPDDEIGRDVGHPAPDDVALSLVGRQSGLARQSGRGRHVGPGGQGEQAGAQNDGSHRAGL